MKRSVKQEIEVKLRVAEAAALRRVLGRLNARALRRVHEMNTLFDTPQGTLRKRGRLLRLRVEMALMDRPAGSTGTQKARRQSRYVLTFKGPAKRERGRDKAQATSLCYTHRGGHKAQAVSLCYTGGRYKVRSETETILPDPQGLLAVFAALGLRPAFRYEKYRTSYRITGAQGVHVELDETPAGVFLELEGPRRAIDRLARRLGYGPADYITRSYAALHFEECRRRGVRAGDMLFRGRKK